jgi:8-oxo-dGTP pyrophosphatase MutT (NUDIX family)
MRLPEGLETEVAELGARYGAPRLIEETLGDVVFDPLSRSDRVGEVCMVIRRPSGRLIVFRKEFYPPGTLRLLTGGIMPGEPIGAALLREVAEETGLEVAVRRFLAAIAYRDPGTPADTHAFYTFAFLLDELGGTLACNDLDEQVELFAEAAPAELHALADVLDGLEHHEDRAIGGDWRSWGRFRAVVHRVVAEELAAG